MRILGEDFFLRDTVEVAKDLLGRYLVREDGGETMVCRITETEAYVGAVDKACHAYGYRKTRRNATMFGPAGHAYLYLIYGMYTCLNFVTNGEGEPDAVLLRGLEVVHGREAMSRLRYGKSWEDLSAYQRKNFLNGPGKCCKALSLDTYCDGMDLTGDELFLCTDLEDICLPPLPCAPFTINAGKRIGIDYAEEAVDFPWRFTLTPSKGDNHADF